MKKAEALNRWKGLQEHQNPLTYMVPLDGKARGSRYGTCGIRIDGNQKFVDAVLSCLKPLIAGENHITRLVLSRNEVDTGFKALPNAEIHAECCYIRLAMRGQDAAAMSAYFDRAMDGATREYASAIGEPLPA